MRQAFFRDRTQHAETNKTIINKLKHKRHETEKIYHIETLLNKYDQSIQSEKQLKNAQKLKINAQIYKKMPNYY